MCILLTEIVSSNKWREDRGATVPYFSFYWPTKNELFKKTYAPVAIWKPLARHSPAVMF